MGDGQFRNVEFSIQINLTWVKKKCKGLYNHKEKLNISIDNRAFNKKIIDYHSQL